MPTDDVSALARLRKKLAGMTPGPWCTEKIDPSCEEQLGIWAGWESGQAALVADCDLDDTAPRNWANATGIVHAVSLARFVADEGTVERVARAICATWDYEWDGDPDADGQVAPDVSDGERPSKALYRRAAARILALIASAGEEA